MQRIILSVLTLMLVSSSLTFAVNISPRVTFESGLRRDQLNWSIAGTPAGVGPNILSELTWENLQIAELSLLTEFDFSQQTSRWGFTPYLRGQFNLGRIYSGEVQDSDYDGDNRSLEFSRTNNGADQGSVFDFSIAAGPKFTLSKGQLELVPLLGYSYHRQNLKLLDGLQTIPADGPFSGLDSRYTSEWQGGWLGLAADIKVSERLYLNGRTEYHFTEFSASGDWNLRSDLAHPESFTQSANGTGWVHELGLKYLWRESLALTMSGVFQEWKTEAGIDQVFLADGSVQGTQLNRVNWESLSFKLGLSYQF